jgi:hypothetical protein
VDDDTCWLKALCTRPFPGLPRDYGRWPIQGVWVLAVLGRCPRLRCQRPLAKNNGTKNSSRQHSNFDPKPPNLEHPTPAPFSPTSNFNLDRPLAETSRPGPFECENGGTAVALLMSSVVVMMALSVSQITRPEPGKRFHHLTKTVHQRVSRRNASNPEDGVRQVARRLPLPFPQ